MADLHWLVLNPKHNTSKRLSNNLGKYLKTIKFHAEYASIVVFHLQAKNVLENAKIYKTVKLWSFSADLEGLEICLEKLKTNQIFHRCFTPYIFCSEKKFKLYFIFSPKNLL